MKNEDIKAGNRVFYRTFLTTGASALALGAATFAHAQTDGDDALAETRDTIVVTGSRIARTGIDTVRPAIGVDAEALDTRAFTNIADALNEVPAFGGGINPDGGQNGFTVGANFVDLFDLGSQRTLTLINGRRFVSSNTPTIFGSEAGTQVDLNMIPVALLERIEVVPLAGAAVYGSDAIAGTVNVILRDDYEGFEVSGQYGVTEEGDGEQWQVQTVFGTNFADDRGNVSFAVEYNKQDGLVRNDRPEIYANDPDFVSFGLQDVDGDGNNDDVDGDGNPDTINRIVDGGQRVQLLSFGGSVSVPPGFFRPSFGNGQLADGNFYQFDPSGDLQSCTPGETPAGSSFFAYGGTCGVDFFDSVTQIRSDLERFITSGFAHYDLTPNIRIVQEMTFANSRANELLNQGGFQSFPFGGTSGPITISVDNPFLTDQARGILTSAPNNLTQFNVNRFNNDLVSGGINSTENFTWRSMTGFEGDFEFANRNWNWDVSGVFGQSDVETNSFGIVDGRFLNAVDAVEVTDALLLANGITIDDIQGIGGTGTVAVGDIVCQVVIDAAAGTLGGTFNENASGGGITDGDLPFVDGCVPLNLFGEGNQSPESLAFINGGPRITSSDIGQRVFTANIGTDLFELPAGAVGIVAGFENRREKAQFTPGLGTAIPITRSSPFPPTSGKLNTTEFYGEALIPIFSSDWNVPGFDLLEIEGSIRSVRNSITDPSGVNTADSVLAWEGGGRWSPVEDVTFRGSYTASIRTPSLVELFSPKVQAFISDDDPCDFRDLGQGPNPAARQANCLAAAAAAGFGGAVIGTGPSDPAGRVGLILDPTAAPGSALANSFDSIVSNATIIGSSSGNPELVPEEARSWTVGVVLEPRWVDNLVITADFFNINIGNRIEQFELIDIFETCFDDATMFPNVACGSFVRGSDFQVIDATEQFLNAASSNLRALSLQMLYEFDLAGAVGNVSNSWGDKDLGGVRFNWNLLRTFNDVTTIVPTRLGDQDAGDFADPTWQGTFDTVWEKGPMRFFYRVEYQDSPLLDEVGNDFFVDDNNEFVFETRARLIHNMSLAYTLFDTTTVQFSVDNLLDRKPNRLETAIGYFGIDEQLGRRYTFRLRSQF